MENAIFRGKQIRRVLHENEWHFSVVDIIEALTNSDNPRDYWYRMKRREKESSGIELSTFCRQLKLTSSAGNARRELETKRGKKVVSRSNYLLETATKLPKQIP